MIIGSGNGLALDRRQVITWTNNDEVNSFTYNWNYMEFTFVLTHPDQYK